MSNEETLSTLLETDRELIRVTGADEQIDQENADTATEMLFSSLTPNKGPIETVVTGVFRAWSRLVPQFIKNVLTICFFIAVGISTFDPTTVALAVIKYPIGPVEAAILAEPLLLKAAGIGVFVAAGIICSLPVIAMSGISNRAPNHGNTVSLALTTAGDGTVETTISLEGVTTSELRTILESPLPNVSLREETTTYGTLLGIDADEVTNSTDYTPHVVQFRLKTHTPYDALSEGTTFADLAAGQDDSGTLVDTLCATLAASDIPALVQTTVTARRRDPGRTDAIARRMNWVHRADPAGAAWTDEDTGAEQRARVFDANVRLLVFEQPDSHTTATELRERVGAALEAVTNDDVTTVSHRAFRVDRSPATSFLSNPGWATLMTTADTLLKRINTETTTYTRAYNFWGLTSSLGLYTRANFVATPREVGRYLYVTDAGLQTSKRAKQSQRRDQTPTGRPPEHIQEQFRADETRLKNTAGTTASQPNSKAESHTSDAASTGDSETESTANSALARVLSRLRS
jgi:hypothetical protein